MKRLLPLILALSIIGCDAEQQGSFSVTASYDPKADPKSDSQRAADRAAPANLPGIDVRLSPFSVPTPQHVRQLIADGKYRPLNYCGNAEFNISLGWADKFGFPFARLNDATPITPAMGNLNQCNPPARRAVTALSLLSKKPGHFKQFPEGGAWKDVPIVFNIEYDPSSGQPDVMTPHEGNLVQRKNALLNHIDALRWCREIVGPDHEVLWFGNPVIGYGNEPEMLELERQAAAYLSAVGAALYLVRDDALAYVRNDGALAVFANARQVESRLERLYPGKPQHYWLHPTWQVYDTNGVPAEYRARVQAMNNQPIPMSLWRQLIDYLRAGGHEYSIWLGGGDSVKCKEQLEYAGAKR